jgi:pyrimidine-specific ribonucleoside hydrolase
MVRMRTAVTVICLGAIVALAACSGSQPTPAPTSTLQSAGTPTLAPASSATTAPPPLSPSPSVTAAARRPVVIDTDMAGDDIIAISVLLTDPTVDVKAIAVDGTGEVHCEPGIVNARRLLDAFGRTEVQVGCGRETPGPAGRTFPAEWRAGVDGMMGLGLPPASKATADADAVTLISNAASGPAPLTIVALGPWTNIADALAADPTLADRIAVHAMGGTVDAPGNIDYDGTSPQDGVEWNLGVDPAADAAVLASGVPITLVPLDATNDVPVSPAVAHSLDSDHAAPGANITYQMIQNNPWMGDGSWYIWDPLAALTVSQPDLVTWSQIALIVKTAGTEAGRLVRDPAGQMTTVAMSADALRVFDKLFGALRRAP